MSDNEKNKYLIVFRAVVNFLYEKNLFNVMTVPKPGNDRTLDYFTPKNTQYSNAVHWFRFHFKKNIPKNDDFTSVIGIHIMPYNIIQTDIKRAVKSCSFCHKFNEQDENFIDLDINSFNLHKYPNQKRLRFQVVLVQKNERGGNGPGKHTDYNSIDFFAKSTLPKEKKMFFKTNWYFPKIQRESKLQFININDDNDNAKKGLQDLLASDIINAMHTVLKDEAFEEYVKGIDTDYLSTLVEQQDPTLNKSAKAIIKKVQKEQK